MKLQKQTSDNCMLYSFAMALDSDVESLVKELGHDGTEVWWPSLIGSQSKRSFNPQEFVDVCLNRGYSLTLVEFLPRSGPQSFSDASERIIMEVISKGKNSNWEMLEPLLRRAKDTLPKLIYNGLKAEQRFKKHLAGNIAVLIGQSASGLGHAVAWDGTQVHDPKGYIYELEKFMVQEAWILHAMR